MAAKTVHGARALVQISGRDPATNQQFSRTIGIWTDFSYTVTYDVAAVNILGRFSPAELVTTGVDPVSVTASGFRVVNHGVYAEVGITLLQDLLRQEGLTIQVVDRQNPSKVIATITDCVPTRHSGGYTVKTLSSISVDFLGLIHQDESATQAEAGIDLPA